MPSHPLTKLPWGICALACLAAAVPSHGVTQTWTGGAGADFETAGNWNPALPANDLATDVALFTGAPPPNLPQLTASRSLGGLLFNTATGGWQLNDNDSNPLLSLGAGGISTAGQTGGTNTIAANLALGATQSWLVGTGGTLLLTGSIISNGAFPLTINDANNLGAVLLSPSTSNSVNLTNALPTNSLINLKSGGVLALGGTGGNATASVNTIKNTGIGGFTTWAIGAAGALQVNSGTWQTGDLGRNSGTEAFLGSLTVNGGSLGFTGARYLGSGAITVNGGSLSVTNAGAAIVNGGRFSPGSFGTSGTATMTINGGFVDLAQANSGNSFGAAINTRVNHVGGTLQNGVTVGGGTNGGTVNTLTLGASGSVAKNATAYTLGGSGVLLSAGMVQGATSTGTGNLRNFNFNGGTLAVGAFNATALGYSSATGAAGGGAHADPVANSVGLGTLYNNGGTLAPGGVGTAGKTALTGNYVVNAGTLAVDLGGTAPATAFQTGQYDTVSVSGTTTLGGTLSVSLLNGYTPAPTDTFTILAGTGTVSGAFTNVAFGSRLMTTGQDGTFLVSLAGKNVTLGSFVTNAPTVPPVITASPQSIGVLVGSAVTFNVSVTAVGARTYQWQKNGANLPGANSASFALASAQLADAGAYTCVVANVKGSVTSDPATLRVTTDPSLLGLLNLPDAVFGSAAPGAAHPGGVVVNYDTTGLRAFTAAPAAGVHPRLFCDDRDRLEIKSRLLNGSPVTTEALKMIRACNLLLRGGRNAYQNSAYYATADRTLADGTPRIPNIGLVDPSASYVKLLAGDASDLTTMPGSNRNAFAGELALEAFYTWVFQDAATEPGHPSFAQRRLDVAAALANWCNSVDPATLTYGTRDAGGGIHMAYAYDFAAPVMTDAQRSAVRAKLALMIYPDPSQCRGVVLEPCATTTNWITLDSWNQMILLSFEGEAAAPEEPHDAAWYADYYAQVMGALHKFYTYGFFDSGTPYEGLGKNYQFNAMNVVYARRGYNFFAHPHVRAFARNYLPAITMPYGFGFSTDDQLGGTGPDPERGKNSINHHEAMGLQWAFHHDGLRDPAVDFVYRNDVQSEYKNAAGAWTEFVNFSRYTTYSTYGNELLPAVLFAQDFDTSQTSTALNAAAHNNSLAFVSPDRGQVVARSGFDDNSQLLSFSARQDFGGHTHADRNGFILAGNGRVWVSYPTGNANTINLQEAQWHNVILVDDRGIDLTNQDGIKARQPGKLAAVVNTPNATAATGDATYAYSWDFRWSTQPAGTAPTTTAALETFNTFRRSDAQIPQGWGSLPFYSFPHWNAGNAVEAVEKFPARAAYNFRNVYRTAALVRGPRPYQLIVDDVRADDDSPHDFKWIAQVPSDLTLVSQNATDTVLGDAAGKRLLIRILQADGTPVQYPGSVGSASAYLRTDASVQVFGQNNRFVIERANVVAPQFKVLLYVHHAGDPLPSTVWSDQTPDNVSGANDTVTVSFPEQTDTLTFAPRALTGVAGAQPGKPPVATEFLLTRAGATGTLLDTRRTVEPAPLVRSSGTFSASRPPTNLTASVDPVTGLNALVWTPAPGAASYRVKRGTTRGGPYTDAVGAAYWSAYLDPTAANPGAYFYVVSALDAAGNETVNSAELAFSTDPLPRGWSAADLNAPTLAGATTNFGPGAFQVSGAGADIYGAADQCQFAAVPWTGDGTLVARVVSLTNTNPSAKAGVMFRDSLDPGAINVFQAFTPNKQVTFQRRNATTDSTTVVNASNNAFVAPYWVKLVRAGNTFSGWSSPDGNTWTQVGTTQTVPMTNATLFAGLAVTSHNAGALATAYFDHVTFTGVPVAPAAPFSATALSESELQLGWANPAFNDTAAAVDASPAGAGAWTHVTTTLPAGGTGVLVTGLAPSTAYDFRVRLTNATGASPWATFSASTPAGVGDGISGAWRRRYFGNGLTVLPGLSGPNDDPDGDGLSNLLESVLAGANPNLPDAAAVAPRVTKSADGRLALAFDCDASRTDVTLTVQAADAPDGPWETAARSIGGAPFSPAANYALTETLGGTATHLEVRDRYLLGDPAHPRRFLRLQVTRP